MYMCVVYIVVIQPVQQLTRFQGDDLVKLTFADDSQADEAYSCMFAQDWHPLVCRVETRVSTTDS